MPTVSYKGRPIAELLSRLRQLGYQIPRHLSYRVVWEKAVSGQISVRREGSRWVFDEDREATIAAELGLERIESVSIAASAA